MKDKFNRLLKESYIASTLTLPTIDKLAGDKLIQDIKEVEDEKI